jgi:hypothetical protein
MNTSLDKLLGISVLKTSFGNVVERVADLPASTREELLRACQSSLRDPKEQTRRASAKLTAALFPHSLPLIQKLLCSKGHRLVYEGQFSLFCFLDDIHSLGDLDVHKRTLSSALADYVQNISTDSSHAAWMAGDLLGDHWPLDDSIPILTLHSKTARFVPGRLAIVHGLSKAIARMGVEDPRRLEVIDALRSMRDRDRSRKVRDAAGEVLLKI